MYVAVAAGAVNGEVFRSHLLRGSLLSHLLRGSLLNRGRHLLRGSFPVPPSAPPAPPRASRELSRLSSFNSPGTTDVAPLSRQESQSYCCSGFNVS